MSANVVEERSPMPKYRQLLAILSDLIDNELEADQQIPSEYELQDRYGMSRMTVRKAVDQLVTEKRLYRVAGVGTFVADRATQVQLHLSSFSEDMAALGIRATQKVLTVNRIAADAEIAAALETRAGDPVVFLERVRFGDDLPVCYEQSYIRAALVPDFPDTWSDGSLFQLLNDRYDLRPNRAQQRIAAARADQRTAEALQIARDEPVLRIRQHAWKDDLLVEFCITRYRSDAYELGATVNQGGLIPLATKP